MNKLPLCLEHEIINHLDILSLYDYSLTNKDNYNEYKNKLKKSKITNEINKLNLYENTKNILIKNMNNKNICLEKYEHHINKLKILNLTRYSDG